MIIVDIHPKKNTFPLSDEKVFLIIKKTDS